MATTKGTAYVWGIDDANVAEGILTNISISKTYANVGTAVSKTGDVIAKRQDDVTETGTITLQQVSAPGETMGANCTITFDGDTFYVTGISDSHTNNGFRETTYNVKKSQYIV